MYTFLKRLDAFEFKKRIDAINRFLQITRQINLLFSTSFYIWIYEKDEILKVAKKFVY